MRLLSSMGRGLKSTLPNELLRVEGGYRNLGAIELLKVLGSSFGTMRQFKELNGIDDVAFSLLKMVRKALIHGFNSLLSGRSWQIDRPFPLFADFSAINFRRINFLYFGYQYLFLSRARVDSNRYW